VSATVDAPQAPGRPRSKDAERAIVDATLEALVEQGYQAMTIEGIAARAGVGKATIYRRWSDKAQLVVDAVRARGDFASPPPRTDDLAADFRAMLELTMQCMRGTDGVLIATFAAERIRHPELGREFERACLAERRARWHELVTEAVQTGRLPADTDIDLVAEVGPAMLWDLIHLRSTPAPRDAVARIAAQFFPLTPDPA
jgi:AcrR family transcriptional regulator